MNHKKIAIAGSGSIGTAAAYALYLRNPDTDIVLLSRESKKSWGKAFDISHCGAVFEGRTITGCDYASCTGADVILITAGTLPKENGTRADVLTANVEIFRTLIPLLAANNPDAVIVNVSNPVDAIAYTAMCLSGFSPERVIGTGTELDSMRLRVFTAEKYGLVPGSLSIPVIGEHGDTMVPLWSCALYEEHPFERAVCMPSDAEKDDLLHRTQRAGWNIREAGEHSCYGIAFSAVRIIEAVLNDSRETLLVSSAAQGAYGTGDVYVSLPSVIGRDGIQKRVLPKISSAEEQQFRASAAAVRLMMEQADTALTQAAV